MNCNILVLADKMLQVVFQNLFSNNMKSSGKSLEIKVNVDDQPEGRVMVSLTDTGSGILDEMNPVFSTVLYRTRKM